MRLTMLALASAVVAAVLSVHVHAWDDCVGDPDCPPDTWCFWHEPEKKMACGIPPWKCGMEGLPCCNGKDCTGSGLTCKEGTCEVKEQDEPECTGDPDCPPDTWCYWDNDAKKKTCGVPPWKCGDKGQICCNGKDCAGNDLHCKDGTCVDKPEDESKCGGKCCGDPDCPEGEWCFEEDGKTVCKPMEKSPEPESPEPCGDPGWPCCDGECPKGDNLVCKDDMCVEAEPEPCGDPGWPCCDGECPKGDGLMCKDGMCVEVDACGDPGWPCCEPDGHGGGKCYKADGYVCKKGVCVEEEKKYFKKKYYKRKFFKKKW